MISKKKQKQNREEEFSLKNRINCRKKGEPPQSVFRKFMPISLYFTASIDTLSLRAIFPTT